MSRGVRRADTEQDKDPENLKDVISHVNSDDREMITNINLGIVESIERSS
jgi:hypothetical protein